MVFRLYKFKGSDLLNLIVTNLLIILLLDLVCSLPVIKNNKTAELNNIFNTFGSSRNYKSNILPASVASIMTGSPLKVAMEVPFEHRPINCIKII